MKSNELEILQSINNTLDNINKTLLQISSNDHNNSSANKQEIDNSSSLLRQKISDLIFFANAKNRILDISFINQFFADLSVDNDTMSYILDQLEDADIDIIDI